jgi:predicted metalloprotease
MRWQTGRQSSNVEDRRGMSGPKMAVGGGGGILVIFGVDPRALLTQVNTQGGGLGGGMSTGGSSWTATPEQEELKKFVSAVLADTEDVWNDLFAQMGNDYREPTLVLFNGSVSSACGQASAAVGPFYCGGDESLYLDFSFFDELSRRFKAPGDFAQAYVIAHEVGHHVQHQLGIMKKVNDARRNMSETEYNELSVRLELQADFFAGVWAHHAQKMRQILEPGDIDEALRAATAIGDDALQRQAQGYVVPDSFTHGTSEQRLKWFKKGFESGRIADGDTFNARDL